MAEKPAKDSMIMRPELCILVLLLFAGSCKRNKTTESIPTGPVNLTIDLNLPSYVHLNNVGNFEFLNGGVRGVILIHDYDDSWYAFERTCAWQPLNDCSKIWIDTMSFQMKCGNYSGNQFQTCCTSRYIFNGNPVNGPARGRLAQYHVQKNGNLVFVYN